MNTPDKKHSSPHQIDNKIAHKTVKTLSSKIAGFSRMSIEARHKALEEAGCDKAVNIAESLSAGGLPLTVADNFIENCIGTYSLPMGLACNFLINGADVLVPMVVEESSVIAAASFGAKLARTEGGFFSNTPFTTSTCQVEFFSNQETQIIETFAAIKNDIINVANSAHPRLISRGGGVTDVELRVLRPEHFVIHIHVNTLEAMGANIVNTMAEEVGKYLPTVIPCSLGIRILTNLCTHRLTHAYCEVNTSALAMAGFSGAESARRIVRAWEFANLDPFRAATHNKGVMNGIDAVVIATGNDWRAVEAGCHAFAALEGRYAPLTHWFITANGNLRGEITAPIAVGTVGGVTKLHPSAKTALQILGNPTSAELSSIIACVGLAQNLSALRALACEGIQQGHMSLHEKNLNMLRRYDNFPHLTQVTPATVDSNGDTTKEPSL